MSKKRVNATLDSFFIKKTKTVEQQFEESVVSITPSSSKAELDINTSLRYTSPVENENKLGENEKLEESIENQPDIEIAELEFKPSTSTDDVSVYIDIGTYTFKNMSDFDRYNILKCELIPSDRKLRFSLHKKCGKEVRCYLSSKHFKQFNWLMYSESSKGIYCKFCFVFAKFCGSHEQTKLQKLVFSPLITFSKLLGKEGDLIRHENNYYHKNSVSLAESFLRTYESPQKDIRNIINNDRLKRVQENRQRLKPIIESIIFLGRQNIPLRGHRDDGELTSSSVINEGNFRELLRFRVEAGDKILQNHLENSSATATYISKTTQNEIIRFCGDEIREVIWAKIRKSKFFSIIFDETTDISHCSQMSFIIRYVDSENCHMRGFY